MRHRKAGVKLSRTSSHRDAMFKNMVTSLLKYERIKTTDVKAKELRRLADQMITLAKRGDLHAQRQAHAVIKEKAVVYKLFKEIAPRFQQIDGGYTRTVRLDYRAGDAAPMMLIELSVLGEKSNAEKKRKKAKEVKSKEGANIEVSKTPTQEPSQETMSSEDKAEKVESLNPEKSNAEVTEAAEERIENKTE